MNIRIGKNLCLYFIYDIQKIILKFLSHFLVILFPSVEYFTVGYAPKWLLIIDFR